jgi:hypothetical protein
MASMRPPGMTGCICHARDSGVGFERLAQPETSGRRTWKKRRKAIDMTRAPAGSFGELRATLMKPLESISSEVQTIISQT